MFNKIKTLIPSSKKSWLIFFLCLIVFGMVFITGKASFDNAFHVYILELSFLALYLLVLREFPPFIDIVKENKIVSLALLFWLISITYSLYNSPLNLIDNHFAVGRYLQTITHVVTFVFFWDFFNRYRPSLKLLYFAIPLSTVCIVIAFVIEWFIVSPLVGEKLIATVWSYSPPFNSHIRHSGYQAVAALSFFMVFFINKKQFDYMQLASFLMLSVLWGFVFWLGGRGAVLSIAVTTLCLFIILKTNRIESRTFFVSTISAITLGLVFSEWASIGSWSGIMNAFYRSLGADSINALSTNRLELWMSAWASVKDHMAFGLGPQGYALMPNHIFGVHPHNVFVQFLVEWGLVGSILFLFLLIKGFISGWMKNVINIGDGINLYSLVAGAVIVTLSVHALFDGTYYHPQPSLYLVIAFAIWIIPNYEKQANKA